MKKLLTLVMAFALIAPSISVNAAQMPSVFKTEPASSENYDGENSDEKVKVQVNENEYLYYAGDSIDSTNIESYTANALYGVAYYVKTITVKSEEQYFPDTMDYEEYKNGCWYSGTLQLGDIIKVSGGWRATYTGYLYIRG